MGGVGIRYWEISLGLSDFYKVILVAPNRPDITSEKVQICSLLDNTLPRIISEHGCDVLIVQNLSPKLCSYSLRYGFKIIADLYDPIILEYLESSKIEEPVKRTMTAAYLTSFLRLNFEFADSIICANEEQKKLWIGSMLMMGLINPTIYDIDSNFDRYVGIVPIGMSDIPPTREGEGFRKKFGISDSDKVLLWGGGVWNWFDPLTLIRAIHKISLIRSDVKLVFMGIKHPNESIPEMKMSSQAVELAKELDVFDKSVFFNFGWTGYNERQSFLLEADIGVYCHQQHLETMFSYRTRILDYLWAKLPIVISDGDSFSKYVRENKLGKVVAGNEVQGWVDNILELLNDPQQYQVCKDNLESFSKKYTWKETTLALVRSIDFLDSLPAKSNKTWYRLALAVAKHKLIYLKQLTFRRVCRKLWRITFGIPLSVLNRPQQSQTLN